MLSVDISQSNHPTAGELIGEISEKSLMAIGLFFFFDHIILPSSGAEATGDKNVRAFVPLAAGLGFGFLSAYYKKHFDCWPCPPRRNDAVNLSERAESKARLQYGAMYAALSVGHVVAELECSAYFTGIWNSGAIALVGGMGYTAGETAFALQQGLSNRLPSLSLTLAGASLLMTLFILLNRPENPLVYPPSFEADSISFFVTPLIAFTLANGVKLHIMPQLQNVLPHAFEFPPVLRQEKIAFIMAYLAINIGQMLVHDVFDSATARAVWQDGGCTMALPVGAGIGWLAQRGGLMAAEYASSKKDALQSSHSSHEKLYAGDEEFGDSPSPSFGASDTE